MAGAVFKFRGLDFTYLGKNPVAAAKAHWQPHPFPVRPAKGQGKQKGKPEKKGHGTQDTDEDARKQQEMDPGSSLKSWFT
eukprot:14501305-Heterocapsa_arctica.AAC.1